MSEWIPWEDPNIGIQEPLPGSESNWTLLAGALILLVVFVYLQKEWFMKTVFDSAISKLALWFIRAAVFISLVSLPLYSYNDLDAAIFTATNGDPYLYSLTVYSLARFGVIHIPTLILAVCITLAFAMAPVISDWLIVAVSAVVERLQAKFAWEELETVEVLEIEEVRK